MEKTEFFAKAEHVSFSADGTSVTLTLALPDGEKERLRIPYEFYSQNARGREGFSAEECEALACESDAYEALCAGLRIVSCGSNTRAEIRKKLFARRHSSESVDRAVAALLDGGYIDEKALIRDEVKKCISKGYGPSKIYARLISRGFSKKYISLVMTQLEDYDFLPACKKMAQKKLTVCADITDPLKKRDKLIVSLKNYGYSAECIRRALSTLSELSEE